VRLSLNQYRVIYGPRHCIILYERDGLIYGIDVQNSTCMCVLCLSMLLHGNKYVHPFLDDRAYTPGLYNIK